MSDLILIADDDPDIVRFVQLNLQLEGFEVVTASDGEEAIMRAREHRPGLVILDVMMPKMDGYQVCQVLRDDRQLSDVSIIMLTAKSMSADKVLGLTAGADDYISKPFDPIELVARVRTTLRRSAEMRSLSPLTGLPGNVRIELELQRRLEAGEAIGLLWLDLDGFKVFNDRYGFARGDGAINELARLLREVTADRPEAFIGHIGGDDFVVICPGAETDELCKGITERFDEVVPGLYDEEDAARRSIRVVDRQGQEQEFPLLTLSIGAAITDHREIASHRELVERATEMKTFAKDQPGSVYAVDRRKE